MNVMFANVARAASRRHAPEASTSVRNEAAGITSEALPLSSPFYGEPVAVLVAEPQLDASSDNSTNSELMPLAPLASSDKFANFDSSNADMTLLDEQSSEAYSAVTSIDGNNNSTVIRVASEQTITRTDAACRRALFPDDSRGSDLFEEMDMVEGDGHDVLHDMRVNDEGNEDTQNNSEPLEMDNGDVFMDPEPEVTPPATRKRRNPAPISNSPRKRGKNVEGWKASITKAAYNAGQAHVNWRGKEIPAKQMGPGCDIEICKRRCQETVPMEERELLFNTYYSITDSSRKWDFLSRLVTKDPVARPTVGDNSRRQNSLRYTVNLSDGKTIVVCKKFFVDTIGQSQQVITTALGKLERNGTNVISPDKRGKHNKKGTTIKPQVKASVREHIASFKTVESHYCRKTSKYKYLPESLNVRKMHAMYLIERNNDPKSATLRQYRDIFNNEFHLKFLRLKKDRCSQCENWKYKTPAEKSAAGEQEKYDMHIANKKKGEALKKEDSLRAKTEADLCVASFDFQKILYCPKGENAAYFYRSKFKCFDFTIFDHRTKEGRCYVWDQTIASKGANEVASCLLSFIEEKAKEGIKQIVFYSDNCWSQNKNSKVLSMFNLACVKYGITITHRFLEKGHTHMEVDNVHACIENRSKNLDIFTPGQWYAIIKSAKINDPKYKLIEMEQKNILDFKNLAEHHSWNLGITKLREIVITENKAYYKHNYEDEARLIIPLPVRPGRPVNLPTFRLKPAYIRKFAVLANIMEDLKWYCDQGHIPSASQPFYRSLLNPVEEELAEIPPDSEGDGDSESEPETEMD
ncbi:hypothetical protein FOCC_FOCC014080 [Frankliniella occidentalis]|nr:hypothetical protein FOCC_FOCC014080 [Frankliniella occidentalis]